MFRKSNTANSVDLAKTEKRRRFWQKTRRRTLWGLAIFIAAHSVINVYASVQLNRELAAIRQKGEQLQFSELAPPLVPDAQNAALIYAKAYKAIRLTGEEKSALNTPWRKRANNTNKLVESAINKNMSVIALTRQAAAMPQCRFPINWQGDPSTQNFPYYRELRELARLLANNARLEASKQNTDAAFRDVLSIFAISRHLDNEPLLIGFLVSQSVDTIANQALATTLELTKVSRAQVSAFTASISDTGVMREYRRSLLGERAMSNYVFFRLERTPIKPMRDMDVPERIMVVLAYPLYLIYQPVLKLDHVQTLRFWDQLINSSEFQQVPRQPKLSESFQKQIDNTPSYAIFTRLLIPVFSKANDNVTRNIIREHQRKIALALAVYRTEHNRYPATLAELKTIAGKPLPLDLYSNQSFKYRPQGNGYLLYSVGLNRTDDNGRGIAGLNHPREKDDDLVWGGSRN